MKNIHKRAATFLISLAVSGIALCNPVLPYTGQVMVLAEETGNVQSETETAATDGTEETVTEARVEEVTETEVVPEVAITLTAPSGLENEEAWVSIQAEEISGSGNFSIAKAEAKLSENGSWQDITADMGIRITSNCSVYIRITDQNGNVYQQNRYIECFDQTKPTLSAAARDGKLTIVGTDEQSGIAAIYVNGTEFSELENNTLYVRLQKADTSYQYFTLQAEDNAGNLSDVYKLTNPYYENPDAISDSTDIAGSQTEISSLPADVTPTEPTSATATVIEHQITGESEDTVEEIYISDTGQVQQSSSSSDEGGKEFYTIQTQSDKVFYLVIDRDKAEENVYLLTEVSENDLLNFTDSNAVTLPQNQAVAESALPTEPEVSEEILITEVPEESEGVETEPQQEPMEQESSNTQSMLILVAALVVVGVIYYYLKFVRGKNNTFDDVFEEDDEEEETVYQEDDDEGKD